MGSMVVDTSNPDGQTPGMPDKGSQEQDSSGASHWEVGKPIREFTLKAAGEWTRERGDCVISPVRVFEERWWS